MNFFTLFHTLILTTIKEKAAELAWSDGLDLSKVALEAPKDPSHGDLSTNAALVLSKQVGDQSRNIAEKLKAILESAFPVGTSLGIAGPGFINITLPLSFWQDQLKLMTTKGPLYRPDQFGAGKKVHIEFVSPNPTGPLHTGHSRNAVLGDAIASTLETVGYDVHRECYINDAGGQVNTLARSVHLRYQQLFGVDVPESAFEGLYPGDYVITMAEKLKSEKGDIYLNKQEDEWLTDIRVFAVAEAMVGIKQDLEGLGVIMDTFTSEAAIAKAGKIDDALAFLEAKGDVYVGMLEAPKGQVIDDFEPRPQTLFRSTNYGDTVDRPLKKSDGSWTYFAPDIAYHFDKVQRGYTDLIDVLGADHIGYFSRITAAVKAMTDDKATLQIRGYNVVNFLEFGVPLKMSKRAGTFISVRTLLDKVGRDVVRFIMLTRHHDMVIDFDFARVVEQNKDNPIFYVQYAHARICSVLRHAKVLWPDMEQAILKVGLSTLTDPSEIDLIKTLAHYPKTVEVAAHFREPHRIAYYLYSVAASFHSLWNKGKENTKLRFIDESNAEESYARLALLTATQHIIKAGLDIFKIVPVQEMR